MLRNPSPTSRSCPGPSRGIPDCATRGGPVTESAFSRCTPGVLSMVYCYDAVPKRTFQDRFLQGSGLCSHSVFTWNEPQTPNPTHNTLNPKLKTPSSGGRPRAGSLPAAPPRGRPLQSTVRLTIFGDIFVGIKYRNQIPFTTLVFCHSKQICG